ERGIELALRSNHLATAGRGYTNLALVTQDMLQGLEFVTLSEDLMTRAGHIEGARFGRTLRAAHLFSVGRWAEALPLIDGFLAECEEGRPHHQEHMVRSLRAYARLARDDGDGAIADLERAVAAARAVKDPHATFGGLGDAAHVYMKLGRSEEAKALALEMIE